MQGQRNVLPNIFNSRASGSNEPPSLEHASSTFDKKGSQGSPSGTAKLYKGAIPLSAMNTSARRKVELPQINPSNAHRITPMEKNRLTNQSNYKSVEFLS